jgi:tetratricopeptide (TPR) repeat protein
VDKDELLERYEALGAEGDFLAARPLFEHELQERERRGQPDAALLRQYGYLLNCHGRYTIRRAIEQYERSMSLDPGDDQVQYLWMGAKASLDEAAHAVARYRERAAAVPGELRALRLLSAAHLAAKDFGGAAEVIETGLAIAPGDWMLVSNRAEVKAARGDPDGALADWRRARELNPDNLGPVYASAFLLEREGRLAEAAGQWQHIVDHCAARGWDLTAVWPRQELQRVRALLHARPARGEQGPETPA